MKRLDEITRVMDGLNYALRQRGSDDELQRWGCTIGECDCLAELHRLLYEEN